MNEPHPIHNWPKHCRFSPLCAHPCASCSRLAMGEPPVLPDPKVRGRGDVQ